MKYWYYVVSVVINRPNEESESFLFANKLSENQRELFPVVSALGFVKSILGGFGKIGPEAELKMTITNQIEISKEVFEELKPPHVGVCFK